MTKYTVDENMLTALESFIKLLNSKDLNEVGQANKALPAIIAAMRMFPEEPIYSPQKGYAHAIYNTEIGSLKNMLCSFDKGMEILNEVSARANLTVKCQCGLDKPCSEGDSLLQGKPCSAGFASCYVLDERKHLNEV